MQSSHPGLRRPPALFRTRRPFRSGALLLALAVLFPAAATAQTGTINGTVTDAETGQPLASAAVEVLGAGLIEGTNSEGRFQVQGIDPGSYSIVVTLIGYETTRLDGVGVSEGAAADVAIAMRSRALVLNPVVVTASRRQEKALDAPASITTVSAAEVARTAATTVADHLRALPGVDAAQTGISQGTVVARGFNGVFSGSLLTIIDNRYARVPSLRFNAYSLFPTNDLDIERIEVSLGPGAALYGPNASSGVMHIVTSSPIDRQGTTVSLTGGERSLFHGQFRSSHAPSENFGFKISGQYQSGTDWQYEDPGEAQARMAGCSICTRNYDSERYSADARLDFRFADDGFFIVNGGTSVVASGVDMTGIGAFQVKNWAYNFAQARLTKGRFFAQAFLNGTDSGGDIDAPAQDGTFGLRTGAAVVDRSRTMAMQFQYGFDAGSWQSFTYGVDWQRTEPRTGGTIFGRNEDDDIIAEVGAYMHSETSLGERVDLVTAIRLDDHNRLADANISPRAALVFRPADDHNFRFTYNRAFSTPTTTNLFLDIVAGRIPLSPLPIAYNVRALGVPSGGFTFSAQCPQGIMSHCMRSPFVPGQRLPANAAALWPGLLELLPSILPANFVPFADLLKSLLANPGSVPGDPAIGTVLRRLNQAAVDPADAFPLDSSPVESIADLTSTIHNTYEVGYKGLINDRVSLAADMYFSRVENFVGPLRAVTPNVFFDPESTTAFVAHRLAPLIQTGVVTLAQLRPIIEGVAQLPLGTIVPDQAESSDLLVTYRNFGQVDFWGADLSAQILASDRLRINANYSFQSDECFDFNEDNSCTTAEDIALNAPSHKGSVGFVYDNHTSGFSFGGRMRMTTAFPMNSGVYVGDVEGYSVLDASVGYQLPFLAGTHVSLTAGNLLNNMHREFVGAPEIGRLVLTRLRYDF